MLAQGLHHDVGPLALGLQRMHPLPAECPSEKERRAQRVQSQAVEQGAEHSQPTRSQQISSLAQAAWPEVLGKPLLPAQCCCAWMLKSASSAASGAHRSGAPASSAPAGSLSLAPALASSGVYRPCKGVWGRVKGRKRQSRHSLCALEVSAGLGAALIAPGSNILAHLLAVEVRGLHIWWVQRSEGLGGFGKASDRCKRGRS